MSGQNLTRGSLAAGLIGLAIPIMAGMFLETLFNLANFFWVGRTGTLTFAAINLSSFVVWLMFSINAVITTGTNSLVARALGANDRKRVQQVASYGVMGSLLVGGLLGVTISAFGDDLVEAMAGQRESLEAATDMADLYLRMLFLMAPVFCVNEALSAVCRGLGDARTPTRLYALGFILNAGLDPFLILGLGGLPRLDIVGAGLATCLSFMAVCLAFFWLLRSGRLAFRLPDRPPRLQWEPIRSLLWIGVPPSISSVVFCLVYMWVTPVVGHFGPEALAALGIGHRIESLAYLMGYGFSLATLTAVAQNVGAGQELRARRTARVAVRLVIVLSLAMSVLTWLAAPWLAGVFSDDPAVLAIAIPYLRIAPLSFTFNSVAMVLEGAFAGFGDTVPATIVTVVTTGLRQPVAAWLAINQGFGIGAIWWVFVALHGVRMVLLALTYRWFLRGRRVASGQHADSDDSLEKLGG